jgi:hypothetical protein
VGQAARRAVNFEMLIALIAVLCAVSGVLLHFALKNGKR